MDDGQDVSYIDRDAVGLVREHLLQSELADSVAGLFWALADPTRVRIIHALSLAELCNGELALILGLTESAVSHQLRDLRLMKVVKAERRGRMVYYRLTDPHIRHVFEDTLRHVQEGQDGP